MRRLVTKIKPRRYLLLLQPRVGRLLYQVSIHLVGLLLLSIWLVYIHTMLNAE